MVIIERCPFDFHTITSPLEVSMDLVCTSHTLQRDVSTCRSALNHIQEPIQLNQSCFNLYQLIDKALYVTDILRDSTNIVSQINI